MANTEKPKSPFISKGEGKVAPNVVNVIIALRGPMMAGTFAYDEMAREIKVLRPIPDPGVTSPAKFRSYALTDVDVTMTQALLQRGLIPTIGRSTVRDAIERVARDNGFHPIRDWLDGLKWDGKSRLDTWLMTYIGALPGEQHNTDYLKAVGSMLLIAMVARIYQPGCKCDYMVVLEGEQGAEKSTVCEALAGGYFSDNLPDVHTKEASQHLRDKWLIEISEMHAASKAETAALKAFLTRREERYRPPYGHEEVQEPRQCVFIGTTNESVYMKDVTGGRRFWPVGCGRLDVKALKSDRDQLFAEAAERFRKGEQWWPSREFELTHMAPVQASRLETDPWMKQISDWLDGNVAGRLEDGRAWKGKTTVGDIAINALRLEIARIGTSEYRRISGVLKVLGWSYSHKTHGRSIYLRPKSKPVPDVFA